MLVPFCRDSRVASLGLDYSWTRLVQNTTPLGGGWNYGRLLARLPLRLKADKYGS